MEPLVATTSTTAEPDDALTEILRSISQGDLAAAQEMARTHLNNFPDSASAHEMMGVVLSLRGEIDKGLEHLQRAVAINPGQNTAITKIGDVFLARGDRERAKAQFQQAVVLAPHDRHAHQRLGLLHELDGDFSEAIRHYEQGIVGTPPGYIGVKVNLAGLYNRAGRFRDAITLLSEAVPDDSRNVTAHLTLGTAWLGLRDSERALAAFDRARKLADKTEQIHLGLGLAHRTAGDLAKSREELERALEINPQFEPAALQLAETLVAQEAFPAAIALLSRFTKTTTAPASLGNRIAEIHVRNRQFDEAAATYETLLADNAADLRTYIGFATLLQGMGRFAQAKDVLETAVEKYPQSAHARLRLGMHHALVQDYAHALVVLERAREMAPADPRIRKAISLAAYRSGQLGRAITEARRLLQLAPDSIDDQFYHASLLEENGDAVAASAEYEALLKRKPAHAGALNNLALIRAAQGNNAAALSLASRAVTAAPENAAVLDTLGWLLHRMGRSAEALPHLEKAVAARNAQPSHRYHLAAVLHATGKQPAAREQLTLALEGATAFAERDSALRLAEQLGR